MIPPEVDKLKLLIVAVLLIGAGLLIDYLSNKFWKDK